MENLTATLSSLSCLGKDSTDLSGILFFLSSSTKRSRQPLVVDLGKQERQSLF